MSQDQTTSAGKRKHRSPNYPYIGLQEALTRAQQIQNEGGIHSVPFRAAMEAWGYKAGTTSSVIAALKSFGLVDISGEGEQRHIRVSERCRKILADHSDTPDLLIEAALSPALYRDLWEFFSGTLPPSDKLISEHLTFTLGFNPGVVDSVIKDFRATIAFARMDKLNHYRLNAEGANIEIRGGEASLLTGRNITAEVPEENLVSVKDDPPPRKTSKPGIGVMFNITIDVLEDGQINVTNGGTLTSETFSILSDVFKLKEKHEKEPPQPNGGTALIAWLGDERN